MLYLFRDHFRVCVYTLRVPGNICLPLNVIFSCSSCKSTIVHLLGACEYSFTLVHLVDVFTKFDWVPTPFVTELVSSTQ